MREDAKNLLARLGISGLTYREFAGRFSDYEHWPLFASMLMDPEARTRLAGAEAALPGSCDTRAMQQQLAALSRSGAL